MHIADVTMFYAAQSGGIRRYLEAKRAWLTRRGVRHTLVVPARNGCIEEQPGTLHLPSVPLAAGYRLPLGGRRAADLIIRARPQIIEAADPYHLAWAAVRARDRLRGRAVAFCHSNFPQLVRGRYGARAERVALGYLRRLYAEFDLVIAPSRHVADALCESGVRRVVRQPLGVDTVTFTPERFSAALRASLQVRPDQKLLVYAGRFAPEKNLDVLIEAARELGGTHRLLLVGAGALPSPLPGNVQVIDYLASRRALATLLASCDAFVYAGDQETFGLAALEAMAAGLPVIGPRAGGIGELLDDGGGVRVEPGDAFALATAVREVLTRPASALRAEARAIAAQHEWPAVFTQLLQRYEMLL